MTETELKQRTKQFALRVMKLVGAFRDNSVGRPIGNQLVRSSTAIGANYQAACRDRSKTEFVAKLGIVVEEADESGYWLELSIEGELLKKPQVEPLHTKANKLPAIMVASRKSAMSSIENPKSKIQNA